MNEHLFLITRRWYKVLSMDGQPIDGSTEQWLLPAGRKKGLPVDFSNQIALWIELGVCKMIPGVTGTWLVTEPALVQMYTAGMRIFSAQLLLWPTHHKGEVIWVDKVRLVREIKQRDLKKLGIHPPLARSRDLY